MIKKFLNIFKEYKELRYLAYHDSLTKLFNRNWLYKNVSKIDKDYIYFIDINNLKEVNNGGHTCGDEYIKEVIGSIEVSSDDIFVRYAGDEFLLFSNTNNKIKTNKRYSVGFSLVKGDVVTAIHIADLNMIKNKKNLKKRFKNK